jgi:hypothetical protein
VQLLTAGSTPVIENLLIKLPNPRLNLPEIWSAGRQSRETLALNTWSKSPLV